jgi:putative phosphoesterase
VRLQPAFKGTTEIAIPPFGAVKASTHKVPLKFVLTIERVYLNELQQIAISEDFDSETLIARVEKQGKVAARHYFLRLLVIAAISGALGALILPWKSLWRLLTGALVGLILIGSLFALVATTYDFTAFRQPVFSGALRVAPWMTEVLAERLADLKALRSEMKRIAHNIHQFYSQIERWQPIRLQDATTVLHVSDIHNNPAAIDLIKRVVKDFKVDLVIDTGDITDFGTPLEAKLASEIGQLDVPYLIALGNHDSPNVVSTLQRFPNVRILNGKSFVKGLLIMGAPDYSASSEEVSMVDSARATKIALAIKERLTKEKVKPVIIAIHDPRIAVRMFGEVPVVLTGHTHQVSFREKAGYVLIDSGTTGAAGIRTFKKEKDIPYTLSLLHFSKNPARLIAVDRITVFGLEREFKLERRLIEKSPVLKPVPKTWDRFKG